MVIIAYTYDADIFCPPCLTKRVGWPGADAETLLDTLAKRKGIDRYDEYSFDGGDFPKVVFDGSHECGECGDTI